MSQIIRKATESGLTLFTGPRCSGVTTETLKQATLTSPRFMIIVPTAAVARWVQCIVTQTVWRPDYKRPFGPAERHVVVCEAQEFTREQIDPILEICATHRVDVWLEGHPPTGAGQGWWAEMVNAAGGGGASIEDAAPPHATNLSPAGAEELARIERSLATFRGPGRDETLSETVDRLVGQIVFPISAEGKVLRLLGHTLSQELMACSGKDSDHLLSVCQRAATVLMTLGIKVDGDVS